MRVVGPGHHGARVVAGPPPRSVPDEPGRPLGRHRLHYLQGITYLQRMMDYGGSVPCFLFSPKPNPETRKDEEFPPSHRERRVWASAQYTERHRGPPRLRRPDGRPSLRPSPAAPGRICPPSISRRGRPLIRQAVVYAIGTDPCGSRVRLAADDETSADRTRLVCGWQQLCLAAGKPEGLTTGEAWQALKDFNARGQHTEILEMFSHWAKLGAPFPDSRGLGYLLRSTVSPRLITGYLNRHRRKPGSRSGS